MNRELADADWSNVYNTNDVNMAYSTDKNCYERPR
jgi:hypothetical protein